MALTKGEAVQVLGRTVEKFGKALDDEETPNEITREELMAILQSAAADAFKEFSD